MAKKKKKAKRGPEKVIELTQGKPRQEEEKFLIQFSGTQLNAVLLIILSATFLVQGILTFLEATGKLEFIKPWFVMILVAILFLIMSVVSITLGGVLAPLRMKREVSLVSFISFMLGFVMFFASIIFLFFII